jgi:membrane-bound metal-dependent hydrolase YbcI (DUF457 family)
MLAGHYSTALLAKAVEPRLPLWLLMLAVQMIDVLWASFILLGIEHLRIDPSLASNPLDLYDMPYTHSLVGALFWAGLAGAGVYLWLRRPLAAFVTGGAVASHWLLDFLVHRQDLLLWHGSRKFGLALWNRPVAAFLLEAVLLAGSAWVLLRARGPAAQPIRKGVIALVVGLLALQLFFTVGPPPFAPAGVAALALLLFATVATIGWRLEHRHDPA